MHSKMSNFFVPRTLFCLFPSPLLLQSIGMDALDPKETSQGCWTYTKVQEALQLVVNISLAKGDSVKSDSGFIDLAFGFDGAKFGGTVFSVSIVHGSNSLGARDVNSTHLLGIGQVTDTLSSLTGNFSEALDFINASTDLIIFLFHLELMVIP